MDSDSQGRVRILVVDDEPLVVSSMARILRRLGFETVGETEPKRALDRVHADPASVDLVLTDYRMPAMSGLELAAQLRHCRRDLPVLLVSGYADQIQSEAALAAGVEQILYKPLTRDEILAALPERLRDVTRGG